MFITMKTTPSVLSGLEISCSADTYPAGKLTQDRLSMFKAKTLLDSLNVIFSPALPDGHMLLISPVGARERCGPAPAHASPLAQPEKEKE